MTRYVIGPDVAIRLAHDQAVDMIRGGHQILAPSLKPGRPYRATATPQ